MNYRRVLFFRFGTRQLIADCNRVQKNSLMLVPAMMIDRFGYRLGYGKGYYDRYIAGYNGVTAGLCYMQDLKI